MIRNRLPLVLLGVIRESRTSQQEDNNDEGSIGFWSKFVKDRGAVLLEVLIGTITKVIVLFAFVNVGKNFVRLGNHYKLFSGSFRLVLIGVPNSAQTTIGFGDFLE
jgi:hypothetical protein